MYKKPCGVFDESYVQDSALVRTAYRWCMLVLFLIGVFVLFPLLASNYLLDVVINMAITTIAALGLQIVVGFTGQISLGHAAFMAVGAYSSAMLSTHLGVSFWIAMPAAAAFAGLIGIAVAVPALRIRGFYVAVTTLAAHYVILWLILHGGNLTKGVSGITAGEVRIGGFSFTTEAKFYYLAMAFAAAAVFLTSNLMRTKIGRAMIAVRDNDLAAEFMGINVFRTKVLAFFLSSLYAGVAGSMLAHYQGIITVDQFTLLDSIWMLAMLVIGGATITGALMGVMFLKCLQQLVLFGAPVLGRVFPAIATSGVAAFMQILFGAAIILFLIFEPRGLFHRWQITLSTFRLWPFPY
jgi:branched-chain amino acid transport system permease protein